MATARESIDVDDDTQLGPLLQRAESGPVFLRRRSTVYRLEPASGEDDIWSKYDADAARRALLDIAGTWCEIDADDLKAYIYKGRDEGTRSADRP